jgi:hypothetical protein
MTEALQSHPRRGINVPLSVTMCFLAQVESVKVFLHLATCSVRVPLLFGDLACHSNPSAPFLVCTICVTLSQPKGLFHRLRPHIFQHESFCSSLRSRQLWSMPPLPDHLKIYTCVFLSQPITAPMHGCKQLMVATGRAGYNALPP